MGLLGFSPEKYRKDFEILNKGIIYMDSSCMSLKPKQVVEAMNNYYNEFPACGGRSNHRLARKVTDKVEETRSRVAKYFNSRANDIIFTKNSTEGINIVANSLEFKEGDIILLIDKEHNSNLIPWQRIAGIKKLKIEFFEFGNIDDFTKKVKGVSLASFVQTSNLDGSSQDVKEMIRIAHEAGVKVLVDGAQSAAHKSIDLKKMGADFFVASGHKMLGPSGTGILFGKAEELEALKPFIVGGETVKDSNYESAEMEDIPHRFEAGLQNYAGIIGLGEAISYLEKVGPENIRNHEKKLNKIISWEISKIEGLTILGPQNPEERGGVISFTVEGLDPHDVALQLDNASDIMVRSGYHCCHSWFNAHNIKGSVRASLYFYNTEDEALKFCEALKGAIQILK